MSYLETIQSFEQCLVDKSYQTTLLSKKGCLSECELNEAALDIFKFQAISRFIPAGQPLTDGYVSSATLDLSAFAAFGPLIGFIQVNGVTVGVLPENTYANIADLIAALVLAINTGGSPYIATGSPVGFITVETTTSSSEANGFVIEIQINPTIQATIQPFDDWLHREIMYINDPNSAFYGLNAIASFEIIAGISHPRIRLFKAGVEQPQSPIVFPTNGFPSVINPTLLAHDQINDRIYMTGFSTVAQYSYVDSNYVVGGLTNPPPQIGVFWLVPPSGNADIDIVYNPFDGCKYMVASAVLGTTILWKIDQNDVVTSIANTMTAGEKYSLKVNPVNGDLWILGPTDIYIINNAGATIATIPVAGKPNDITYYPGDGTAGSERMFVAVYNVGVNNSFIATFQMNGTVDVASLYTLTALQNTFRLLYSVQFNLIFITSYDGLTNSCDVVRLDGSLKTSILIGIKTTSMSYTEDFSTGQVITTFSRTTGGVSQSDIIYFDFADDGEEVFDGALEGGVDPTFTTGEGNCITQDQVDQVVSHLTLECASCVGDVIDDGGSVIRPPESTVTIYFGNSATQVIGFAAVEALGSVMQAGYQGSYSFDATAPSEYKIIAWPSSLGTPTTFTDPSTGFPVAMGTSYTVIINLIQYTVIPTYNKLGGAITIDVA